LSGLQTAAGSGRTTPRRTQTRETKPRVCGGPTEAGRHRFFPACGRGQMMGDSGEMLAGGRPGGAGAIGRPGRNDITGLGKNFRCARGCVSGKCRPPDIRRRKSAGGAAWLGRAAGGAEGPGRGWRAAVRTAAALPLPVGADSTQPRLSRFDCGPFASRVYSGYFLLRLLWAAPSLRA